MIITCIVSYDVIIAIISSTGYPFCFDSQCFFTQLESFVYSIRNSHIQLDVPICRTRCLRRPCSRIAGQYVPRWFVSRYINDVFLTDITVLYLAFIQAPFFVHLEMLFSMGLFADTHKRIQAAIDSELAKTKAKKTVSQKKA